MYTKLFIKTQKIQGIFQFRRRLKQWRIRIIMERKSFLSLSHTTDTHHVPSTALLQLHHCRTSAGVLFGNIFPGRRCTLDVHWGETLSLLWRKRSCSRGMNFLPLRPIRRKHSWFHTHIGHIKMKWSVQELQAAVDRPHCCQKAVFLSAPVRLYLLYLKAHVHWLNLFFFFVFPTASWLNLGVF